MLNYRLKISTLLNTPKGLTTIGTSFESVTLMVGYFHFVKNEVYFTTFFFIIGGH